MKKIFYFLGLPFVAIYLTACVGGTESSPVTPTPTSMNTIKVTSEPADLSSVVNGEKIKLTFTRNSQMQQKISISGTLSDVSTSGKSVTLCAIPAGIASCTYEYTVPGNVESGPYTLTLTNNNSINFNSSGKITGNVYNSSVINMSTPSDVSVVSPGALLQIHFTLAANESAPIESQVISLDLSKLSGWEFEPGTKNVCTLNNSTKPDCWLYVHVLSSAATGSYILPAINNTPGGLKILNNPITGTVESKAMINVSTMVDHKNFNINKVVPGETFDLQFTPTTTGTLPSGDNSVSITSITPAEDFILSSESCTMTSSNGCSIRVQVESNPSYSPFTISLSTTSSLPLHTNNGDDTITGSVVGIPQIHVSTAPKNLQKLPFNTPVTVKFDLANAESGVTTNQNLRISFPESWGPSINPQACFVNSATPHCSVTLNTQTAKGKFSIDYKNDGTVPVDGNGTFMGTVFEIPSVINITTSPKRINHVISGESITFNFEIIGGESSATVGFSDYDSKLFTPIGDTSCTAARKCSIKLKVNPTTTTESYTLTYSSNPVFPIEPKNSISGTIIGTEAYPYITVAGLPESVTAGQNYTLKANLENSFESIPTQTISLVEPLPSGWTAPTGESCTVNHDTPSCPITINIESTALTGPYTLKLKNAASPSKYTVPLSESTLVGTVGAYPVINVSVSQNTSKLVPTESVVITFTSSAGPVNVFVQAPSSVFTPVGSLNCPATPQCSVTLQVNKNAQAGNYTINLSNDISMPFSPGPQISATIIDNYPQITVTNLPNSVMPGESYTLTANLANNVHGLANQTISITNLPSGWGTTSCSIIVTESTSCSMTLTVPSNATPGNNYTFNLQNVSSDSSYPPAPLSPTSFPVKVSALPSIVVNTVNGFDSIQNSAIAMVGGRTESLIITMSGGDSSTSPQNISLTSKGISANFSGGSCNVSPTHSCSITVNAGSGDSGIGQLSITDKTSSSMSINYPNLAVLWAPYQSDEYQYEAVFNVSVNPSTEPIGSWSFQTASDNSEGPGVHGEGDKQSYTSTLGDYIPYAGLPSDFDDSDTLMKPKLYLYYPSSTDFYRVSNSGDGTCDKFNFVQNTSGTDSAQGSFTPDTVGLEKGALGYFTATANLNGTQKLSVTMSNCQFVTFNMNYN